MKKILYLFPLVCILFTGCSHNSKKNLDVDGGEHGGDAGELLGAAHSEQRFLSCAGYLSLTAPQRAEYYDGVVDGMNQYADQFLQGLQRDIALFGDLLGRIANVLGESGGEIGSASDVQLLFVWHYVISHVHVGAGGDPNPHCASPQFWTTPAAAQMLGWRFDYPLNRFWHEPLEESLARSLREAEKLSAKGSLPVPDLVGYRQSSRGKVCRKEKLISGAYIAGLREGVMYLSGSMHKFFSIILLIPVELSSHWKGEVANMTSTHLSVAFRTNLDTFISEVQDLCSADGAAELGAASLAVKLLLEGQRQPEEGVLVEDYLYLPGGDDYYDEADLKREGFRAP